MVQFPRLQSCCCCIGIRNGLLAWSVIGATFNVLGMFRNGFAFNKSMFLCINLITCIIAILGILKENLLLITISMIFRIIAVISSLVILLLFFLGIKYIEKEVLNEISDEDLMNYSKDIFPTSDGVDREQLEEALKTFTIICGILLLINAIIEFYFTWITYSYYMEIKDKQNMSLPTNMPMNVTYQAPEQNEPNINGYAPPPNQFYSQEPPPKYPGYDMDQTNQQSHKM